MNKGIFKIAIALIVFNIISGCTKESGISVPDVENLLVITGNINPYEKISISVTSTRNTKNPTDIEVIENAEVILKEDGRNIGILTFKAGDEFGTRGTYTLDYYPKVGMEYEIEAQAEGFTPVTASTMVPEIRSQIVSLVNLGIDDQDMANIQLTFKDNGSGSDFYQIVLYKQDSLIYESDGEEYVSASEESRAYFKVSQSSLEDEFLSNDRNGYEVDYGAGGFIISDEFFQNTSKSINMEVFMGATSGGENEKLISNIRAEIRTITESYYKYEKSIFLQSKSIDNPLTEPVLIYNNIENGLGNFSSYNAESTKIRVEN